MLDTAFLWDRGDRFVNNYLAQSLSGGQGGLLVAFKLWTRLSSFRGSLCYVFLTLTLTAEDGSYEVMT